MTEQIGGRPVPGMNAAPSARPWYGYPGANPDGWFDPARGAATTEATVANMWRVGGRLARVEFPWYLIEPERGTYDWSRVDHIVATVKAAGLRLHVQLLYPPAWAAAGSTIPGPPCRKVTDGHASGVPDPAALAAFVTALLRHVRDTSPGGLPFVEIGNEYDLPHYFAGTPADYVRSQLVPGHAAAKAVDPAVTVLLAGWARSDDLDWLRGVLGAGGRGHFDAVSFHRYGSGESVLAAAARIRAFLDAQGMAGVPLWVTEFGAVEDGTGDTGHQDTIRAVLGGRSALAVAEWYEMHDDDVYGTATGVCQREPFGLVGHDGTTTKAGYLTWQSLAGGGASVSVGAGDLARSGGWVRSPGPRAGRPAGTSLRCDHAGSTAGLRFLGTRVRLFGTLSPAGGRAEVTVDGGAPATVDTYSPLLNTDQEVWDSGPLGPGTHRLTVRVTGTAAPAATGAWVELDRAVVQNATPATVDDATTGDGEHKVRYAGAWQAVTGVRDGRYAGTSHRSERAGSTAALTFVGSRVAVRMNLSPAGGRAGVAVDDAAPALADSYSPVHQTDRQVWASGDLGYGRHTVTVTVLGTSDPASAGCRVDLDRFDLR